MKTVHYVQMGLAGLIQAGVTAAIILPAPYAHYCLIAVVLLVAFLAPLGLASPAMLAPDPALVAALQGAPGTATTTTTATVTALPKPPPPPPPAAS